MWKLSALLAVATVSVAVYDAKAVDLSPGDVITHKVPIIGPLTDLTFERWDPETGQVETLSSTPIVDQRLNWGGFVAETRFHPPRHKLWVPMEHIGPSGVDAGQVVEVDLTQGTVSVVVEDPLLIGIAGIALEANGDLILLVSRPHPESQNEPVLLRFTPATEMLDVLSDGVIYPGSFNTGQPKVLADGNILFPQLATGVFRVNSTTGERSLEVPVAGLINGAASIDIDQDGNLYVGGFQNIVKVNLATGEQTELFNHFAWVIEDIEVSADGTITFASLGTTFSWDPDSGQPPSYESTPNTPGRGVEIVFPECSDGLDNDGDMFTDFGTDPHCGSADDNQERFQRCGLGFELIFALGPVLWLRRRSSGN